MESAKAGVTVVSLCETGDAFIMAETGKVFRKEKDLKKGMGLISLVKSMSCIDMSHE